MLTNSIFLTIFYILNCGYFYKKPSLEKTTFIFSRARINVKYDIWCPPFEPKKSYESNICSKSLFLKNLPEALMSLKMLINPSLTFSGFDSISLANASCDKRCCTFSISWTLLWDRYESISTIFSRWSGVTANSPYLSSLYEMLYIFNYMNHEETIFY